MSEKDDLAAIDRIWKEHVRTGRGALQDFALRVLEWERTRVATQRMAEEKLHAPLIRGEYPETLDPIDIPKFLRDITPEPEVEKAVTCLVMGWPMRIILDPTLKPGEMLLVQRPPKFYLDPKKPTEIKQCTCEYFQECGSDQWVCEVHGFIRSKK